MLGRLQGYRGLLQAHLRCRQAFNGSPCSSFRRPALHSLSGLHTPAQQTNGIYRDVCKDDNTNKGDAGAETDLPASPPASLASRGPSSGAARGGHVMATVLRIRRLLLHDAGTTDVEDITADEFDYWRRVVRPLSMNNCLTEALRMAGRPEDVLGVIWDRTAKGEEARAALSAEELEGMLVVRKEDMPPPWVLIFIIATRTGSANEAHLAINFVITNLDSIPPAEQPAILVLLTYVLAKQQLTMLLPPIIKAFLLLPSVCGGAPASKKHFNNLLHSLSYFPASTPLAKLTIKVLDVMTARQISLYEETYRALLTNRIVTLELTRHLQAKMVHEGFVPEVEHLEAFLKIFGQHGAVEEAATYRQAIDEMEETQAGLGRGDSDENVDGVSVEDLGVDRGALWNAKYIASFKKDRASAFAYLLNMVPGHAPSERPSGRPRADPVETAVSEHLARLQLRGKRETPTLTPRKKGISVVEWTAYLRLLACDKHVDAQLLFRFFQRSNSLFPAGRSGGLTLVSYTVLLLGLAKRREYGLAWGVWKDMQNRVVDAKALTVGLDVLIGMGRVKDAFLALDVVHKHERPSKAFPSGSRRTRRLIATGTWTRHEAVPAVENPVDLVMVNALMSALVRHGRPDIALKVWDSMELLYGVKPNAASLGTVLKAAKSVAIAEETFEGLFIRVKSFFSAGDGAIGTNGEDGQVDVQHARERAFEDILLAIEKRPVALWKGVPAAVHARKLFLKVLFELWPQLKDVVSPAHAVRSDAGGRRSEIGTIFRSAFALAKGALGEQPTSIEQASPQEVPDIESGMPKVHPNLPTYPFIIPEEMSFLAYIELLAVMDRASEIPLVLAWMRALGIQPCQRTRAIALVRFVEVGSMGPLVERANRPYAKALAFSEYQKLQDWFVDWLGEDALPEPTYVRYILNQMRAERRARMR